MSCSGESAVAWKRESRSRAPYANSGKPLMLSIETTSESRPKSVTYHGMPAAGT